MRFTQTQHRRKANSYSRNWPNPKRTNPSLKSKSQYATKTLSKITGMTSFPLWTTFFLSKRTSFASKKFNLRTRNTPFQKWTRLISGCRTTKGIQRSSWPTIDGLPKVKGSASFTGSTATEITSGAMVGSLGPLLSKAMTLLGLISVDLATRKGDLEWLSQSRLLRTIWLVTASALKTSWLWTFRSLWSDTRSGAHWLWLRRLRCPKFTKASLCMLLTLIFTISKQSTSSYPLPSS